MYRPTKTVQVTKFTPKIESEGRTPTKGNGSAKDNAHGICTYGTSPNRSVPYECAHGQKSRKGLRG